MNEKLAEPLNNIMNSLESGGMCKKTLKGFADTVLELENKHNISPVEIFPIGIIAPDSVVTKFRVKKNDLPALITNIVGDGSIPIDIRTFPVGIIAPREFEVTARIGNRGNSGSF
ncbi:MAG: hypothetical protein HOJ79_14205 [Nitrospina sp.]|jgi:hypothetical protein|nr:hypothetical protein [Nitrospina sp.]